MSFSKSVQTAKAAVDASQREVSRVNDAISATECQIEKLAGSLKHAPDRSGELSELMAAQALGEATDKDVAALRAIIAKEAEAAGKRNASDLARIGELEAQLSGLRIRLAKAEYAEAAAHRALREAVVAGFQADAEQHSKELVKALKATSDAFERFAAACMALDSVDNIGRLNLLVGCVKLELSGNWPLPGVEYETLATLGTYESRRLAFGRFEKMVDELAALGVELKL